MPQGPETYRLTRMLLGVTRDTLMHQRTPARTPTTLGEIPGNLIARYRRFARESAIQRIEEVALPGLDTGDTATAQRFVARIFEDTERVIGVAQLFGGDADEVKRAKAYNRFARQALENEFGQRVADLPGIRYE